MVAVFLVLSLLRGVTGGIHPFLAFYWRCHGGSEGNSHESGVHIELSWIETPQRQSNYSIDREHLLLNDDQVF